MVGVTVSVDLSRAREILRRFAALTANPRPLLESAGALLENSTRERFQTSRGPGGVPWPPSGRQRHAAAPGTGASNDPRNPMGPNPGGRTLIDTGGLLNSITHRVEDHAVVIGVIAKTPSAKHAAVHQFGATIVPRRAKALVFRAPDGHMVFAQKVTIPARPFLGIDEDDRADVIAVWQEQLEALTK